MQSPKISVIIPAYNEEAVLTETLRAVLNQDYNNFEIIVIDNASTDKTFELARAFPIKVISESRKGTMWACERGRLEARGDIIVRIDADCIPTRDWLKRGVRAFQDQSVVAVTGPYDYFDAHPLFTVSSLILQKYVYHPMNSLFQYANKGAILIGGNSFMRASALDAIGGFNTHIVFYGDDSDTAKRLAAKGTVVFDRYLTMKTSARRFKAEGAVRITLKYLFHFFKITFSGKKKVD
jgi:glycosyltransferase involved in cell wall biosynthesis